MVLLLDRPSHQIHIRQRIIHFQKRSEMGTQVGKLQMQHSSSLVYIPIDTGPPIQCHRFKEGACRIAPSLVAHKLSSLQRKRKEILLLMVKKGWRKQFAKANQAI
jgi:predicted transcriptional regulator